MFTFDNLPQSLQEFLIDPRSSTFIFDFLKSYNKNIEGVAEKVSQHVTDCIYDNISIEQMLTLVKTTCLLSDTELEDFFDRFLEILGENGLNDLEKESSNNTVLPETYIQKPLEKRGRLQTIEELHLDRDPQLVQTKLLQVLEQFNLHVDEKGVIAHEVERYLKGEVLSKDLLPHLTAMLDKPLSEVQAIITALNTTIFKPIQKQIAEEGTIDISYDDDDLQNILIPKKKASVTETKPLISFLPKEIRTSGNVRSRVLSDLRTQGGTPHGTSLLSQEIGKENIKTSSTKAEENPQTTPQGAKTYTVDPYREII